MNNVNFDDTGQTVARNAVYLLVAKAISTSLGLILVLYMARSLGDAQFGIYTIGLAMGGICGIIADVGLNNLTTRQLARDPSSANDFLGNVVLIKLTLALPVLLGAYIFLTLFGYEIFTRDVVLILICNSLFFHGLQSFYYHIIEGFERMQYITILEVVKRIFYLISGILVIYFGYGILVFALALLTSDLLNFLIIWWVCRHNFEIRMNLRASFKKWPALIKKGLPYGLLLAFTMILSSTDIIMIGAIRTEEEAGWYGACVRLISTLTLIPLMSASAMFPSISRLYHEGTGNVGEILINVIRPMVLVGIPIAIGTTVLSEPIILLLFGQTYISSAPALSIVIWSLSINFITMPMVFFLSAVDKQWYATTTMAICALVNIILNIILIPGYGIIGASITTIISQIALFGFCYVPIRSMISVSLLAKYLLQSGLSSLGLWYYLTIAPSIHVIIVISIGVLIYLLLLILTRALRWDDWERCKHILNPG